MDRPQRSEIIELLNRLGADDDAEALAAARSLNHAVRDAGLQWDELLVPDSTSAPSPEEPASSPSPDEHVEADDSDDMLEATETPASNPEEDLRLIDRLLDRDGLAEETREDLSSFRTEAKEGRLTEMDSRYIRALAKRLGI